VIIQRSQQGRSTEQQAAAYAELAKAAGRRVCRLASMTICLYKLLTRRTRANTVLREPQCGPDLDLKGER
jgi:hypothetical protein